MKKTKSATQLKISFINGGEKKSEQLFDSSSNKARFPLTLTRSTSQLTVGKNNKPAIVDF